MKRAISILLLATAFAITATAAQPKAKIAGKLKVPEGQAIILDGGESVSDSPLQWKLLKKKAFVYKLESLDGSRDKAIIVHNPIKGYYDFSLTAIGTPPGAKEPTTDTDVVRVHVYRSTVPDRKSVV